MGWHPGWKYDECQNYLWFSVFWESCLQFGLYGGWHAAGKVDKCWVMASLAFWNVCVTRCPPRHCNLKLGRVHTLLHSHSHCQVSCEVCSAILTCFNMFQLFELTSPGRPLWCKQNYPHTPNTWDVNGRADTRLAPSIPRHPVEGSPVNAWLNVL